MRSLADAYQRPEPRVYRVRYRQRFPWEKYRWEAVLFYTDGTECWGYGHTLEDAAKSATYFPIGAWRDGEPLTWGDLISVRPDILD